MADPTLNELLVTETADALLEFYLTELSPDFPVTDWVPGGFELVTLAAEADAQADAQALVVDIAKGSLLDLAEGPWLTLYAKSHYGITRHAAASAVPHVRLTNATGSPYTITPGMLKMTRNPADDGRTWESANATNVTLPASSTLDLDFRAESPGDGTWNLTSAEPVVLSTPLPGVTAALLDVGISGSPMTTSGTAEESDPQLRQRCATAWPSLAFAGPALAYVKWARDADPQVTKVYVDDTNPDGPGTVRVYFAGTAGGVSSPDADAAIQLRKPETAAATCQAATTDSVSFAGTIFCESAFIPAAKTAIYQALRTLQTDLPIGDGAGAGRIDLGEMIAVFRTAPGVRRVTVSTVLLAGVAADYTPTKGHIAQLASLTDALSTLTFTAV